MHENVSYVQIRYGGPTSTDWSRPYSRGNAWLNTANLHYLTNVLYFIYKKELFILVNFAGARARYLS
jgi:hypothetical protein